MVDVRKAKPWDHVRFVISALFLLFSMVVTSYAIVMNKTSFFKAVPGYVALLLFIIDLIFLGIVEGLQIALVELKRQHPDSYKVSHPTAYRLGQMAAKGDNVERFLMGRQVCVVVLVFFAAKLTTIHATDADGDAFMFPVAGWVQAAFFETGLVACITVVILAQLMPQIVAAQYPVHFLQFIIMKPAYYFCIFLEITGLTHICWVLSALMLKITRIQDDKTTKNPVKEDDDDASNASEALANLHVKLEAGSILENETIIENGNVVEKELDKEVLQSTDFANVNERRSSVLQGQFSSFSGLVEMINRTVRPDTLRVLKQYLDSHPEKFSQFPSVIGNRMYPSPKSLADCFKEDGHPVPRFLTDISDPEHIPPHIVACELLVQNKRFQEELHFIKRMNAQSKVISE